MRRDNPEDITADEQGGNAFITDILTCSEEDSEVQQQQQQQKSVRGGNQSNKHASTEQEEELQDDGTLLPRRKSSRTHPYQYNWRGRISQFKWSRLSRKQKGGAICSIVSASCVVLFLLFYLVIIPQIITDYASHVQFNFVNVTMTDPQARSLRLMCAAEVTVDMPVAAHCGKTLASLYFEGKEVGSFDINHMDFPQGNHTTLITNWDTLEISNLTLFSTLARKMLMEKSSVWTLKMVTTIWADVGSGVSIPFYGIHITTDVLVPGMGGLSDVELVKYDVLLDENGNALTYVAMKITDNCVINVDPIGTITMEANVLGSREAILTVKEANIHSGANTIVGSGPVDISNQTVLNYVFYQYLNGKNTTIESRVTHCSIPLYDSIFSGFTMNYVLQGNDPFKTPLVVAALMEIDLKMILSGLRHGALVIPAQLYLHYFFTAPIEFTAFDLDVTYNGTSLGGFKGPMIPSLIVPGNSLSLTRVIPITADVRLSNMKMFLKGFGEEIGKGITYLGLRGSFTFRVGNVQATASTEQPPVPTCHPSSRELCKIPYDIQ